MQKRKFDELISHFNRKVSDMSIDQKYKMELLGMISAIGFAHEKELGTNLASLGTDCISRHVAIDAIERAKQNIHHNIERAIGRAICEILDEVENGIKQLPPIQPEITHEQAVAYLQSTGWTQEHDRQMMIDGVHRLTAQPEPHWIPCSERLPECEQEVLICTRKKVYVSRKTGLEWIEKPIITPALYEDGTMLEIDSKWRWEDIDYAGWNDEEDCGIIPEGWWENRHFNPDEVYNNPVDREVIAWMPLPEPYKGVTE